MADARPAWRPPEAYVHGPDAAVVVVPARVAAWLLRHTDLARLRATHRGADPEVDAVLVALTVAGSVWRQRAGCGTNTRNSAEPVPASALTTTQAADLLNVTPRAVRKAIAAGRLTATHTGTQWLIDREDFEHYRAA